VALTGRSTPPVSRWRIVGCIGTANSQPIEHP
jgi:hypothetical protein